MNLSTNPKTLFSRLSLRHKILILFFLIIVVFGGAVAYGTYHLLRDALNSTANQRLTAIQEIVFREIKKQEFLLLTYANMVEFQHYSNNENQTDPYFSLRQDRLLHLLGEGNVTATIYPAPDKGDEGTFSDLFRQTLASGEPRFRFLATPEVLASLSVAIPLNKLDEESKLLLLQTPIDSTFLKQIVTPFNTAAAILDLQGKPLVTTSQNFSLQNLNEKEMARLLSGTKISRTVELDGYHRQLYSAIPIGKSEIVILAVDLPLSDLDLLMKTLGTRTGGTILLALILGSFIYYRLIRTITNPLKNLLIATEEIGQGNLSYRITNKMSGEFQQLADAFNGMIGRLETLYLEKTNQDKEMALANAQLRFKELLEEKNQEIQRSNHELRIHLREISMLLQLNQVMNSTLEISVMFDRTLSLLRDFLGSSNLVLLLYHPETDELSVRKTVGAESIQYTGTSFKLNEGITGVAAQTKELLYVQDIATDARYLHYKNKVRNTGSLVSAPIVAKDHLLGVLNLHKPEVEAFTETELSFIRAAANQLAIAIENSQLYEKTRTLSNTDELTNIPNRRYFQAILRREFAEAQRYNTPFSIIMVDIDHFKQYNDAYGHLNGDIALSRVANILLQNTRGIDLVARYGGEEFILLLPKTNKESAFFVAEKLRNAVANEDFLPTATAEGQRAEKVTISLGIAEYPTDSLEVDALIEKADRALYAAKEAGRNSTICCQSDSILKDETVH